MPTSVATATVLALAIIPGAFGAYVWALVNGQDWREKDWQAAIRFLAFSVLGLAFYVLASIPLGLPPAIHVLPATYESAALKAGALSAIFRPYLGHIISAGLLGAVAAGLHRAVCALRGSSPQPSAWDHFLKNEAPKRWVVVTLKSGDIYAGYIQTAEESAPETKGVMLDHLIGQFGRALTPLRPSGLVDFEGRRLDGLSEEGLIPSGALVRAVQVRSGQIVVRAASEKTLDELFS